MDMNENENKNKNKVVNMRTIGLALTACFIGPSTSGCSIVGSDDNQDGVWLSCFPHAEGLNIPEDHVMEDICVSKAFFPDGDENDFDAYHRELACAIANQRAIDLGIEGPYEMADLILGTPNDFTHTNDPYADVTLFAGQTTTYGSGVVTANDDGFNNCRTGLEWEFYSVVGEDVDTDVLPPYRSPSNPNNPNSSGHDTSVKCCFDATYRDGHDPLLYEEFDVYGCEAYFACVPEYTDVDNYCAVRAQGLGDGATFGSAMLWETQDGVDLQGAPVSPAPVHWYQPSPSSPHVVQQDSCTAWEGLTPSGNLSVDYSDPNLPSNQASVQAGGKILVETRGSCPAGASCEPMVAVEFEGIDFIHTYLDAAGGGHVFEAKDVVITTPLTPLVVTGAGTLADLTLELSGAFYIDGEMLPQKQTSVDVDDASVTLDTYTCDVTITGQFHDLGGTVDFTATHHFESCPGW